MPNEAERTQTSAGGTAVMQAVAGIYKVKDYGALQYFPSSPDPRV